MKTYDIVLIGTGQATGTILPDLLKAGKNIAVISVPDREDTVKQTPYPAVL
jgi:hypothetical protein